MSSQNQTKTLKKKATKPKKTAPISAEFIEEVIESVRNIDINSSENVPNDSSKNVPNDSENVPIDSENIPVNNKKVDLENLDKLIDNTLKLILDERDEGKKAIEQLRKIKKDFKAVLREVKKYRNRRTQRAGGTVNHRRSGFYDPRTLGLSTKLCEFLGVDHGTRMSHDAVAERVRNYIKNNNLQNPENRRDIILDEKLERLFGNETERRNTMEIRKLEKPSLKSEADGKLSYFNLQSFLRPHFIKTVVDEVPTSVASSSSA